MPLIRVGLPSCNTERGRARSLRSDNKTRALESAMRRIIIVVGVAVVGGVVFMNGCSREDRDEAMSRLGNAGKALNGEVRPDDKEHETPNIVTEQQRRERIRQNTKWTAENQAKYPIEYCQAMLEEITKDAKQYEVAMHKCLLAKASVSRKITDSESQVESLSEFLEKVKGTYREAEAKNSWPVEVNGFALSKEKLQEKIVDVSQRISSYEKLLVSLKINRTKLEKKAERVSNVQKKLSTTRESLQRTLDNLHLKQVVDNEDGIKDSINAINAVLDALGDKETEISLDDLVAPDKDTARKEAFEAIMAQ